MHELHTCTHPHTQTHTHTLTQSGATTYRGKADGTLRCHAVISETNDGVLP